MNVLIVTGIWPPDVGGPASHSPELAERLHAGGHRVEVLTTAVAAPAGEAYPVHWIGRGSPPGVRHATFALRLARLARAADVVYVNSVTTRGVSGARAARRPVVVKLTDDPAYERARRFGLFDGDLDGFQRFDGGPRVRALRVLRDTALRRASLIVCPSAYLREHAIGWGLRPEQVVVVENAIPELPELPTREQARAALGIRELDLTAPVLAFAGRLGPAKALNVALAALVEVEEATLLLAGDGPERESLESLAAELGIGERVRFLGAVGRREVLELFRAADASVLSSEWENFPHTLVEALAVGTPVVATAVGGVPEIVHDGGNGLLVPPGDPAALTAALRRFLGDAELQRRLSAAAAPSVEHLRPERVYAKLEELLAQVASRR